MRITCNNIINNTFHPLSEKLNTTQKVMCCVFLVFFSLTTAFIAPVIYYSLSCCKVKKIKPTPTLTPTPTPTSTPTPKSITKIEKTTETVEEVVRKKLINLPYDKFLFELTNEVNELIENLNKSSLELNKSSLENEQHSEIIQEVRFILNNAMKVANEETDPTTLNLIKENTVFHFSYFRSFISEIEIKERESHVKVNVDDAEAVTLKHIRDWSIDIRKLIAKCRYFVNESDKKLFKELIGVGKKNGWIGQEINHLPNKDNFLNILAKIGHPLEFVDILEDSDCNFNYNEELHCNNTPLLWAIANAKYPMALKILTVVLKRNLSVNLKDKGHESNTSLHLLLKKGIRNNTKEDHEKLLNLLIKNTDLNLKDRDGNTPLHLACRRHDWNIAAFLLDNGANKDLLNDNGENPLKVIDGNFNLVLQEMGGEVVSTLEKSIFDQGIPEDLRKRL